MDTIEDSAHAEPRPHGHTEAPSSSAAPESVSEPASEPPPETAPQPPAYKPSVDDFHPAVQAISRIKTAGRTYAKKTEVAANIKELVEIAGNLMSAIKHDDAMAPSLRIQSALIDSGFTALLMKTTQDDGFDEGVFEAALRAQRQYRITCQTLLKIKKYEEQTEMRAQKASGFGQRHSRFSDPFAGM